MHALTMQWKVAPTAVSSSLLKLQVVCLTAVYISLPGLQMCGNRAAITSKAALGLLHRLRAGDQQDGKHQVAILNAAGHLLQQLEPGNEMRGSLLHSANACHACLVSFVAASNPAPGPHTQNMQVSVRCCGTGWWRTFARNTGPLILKGVCCVNELSCF